MLAEAADQVAAAGYRISNLDCIVLAQKPKLSSHKRTISRRIAEILNIESSQVAIKAKTGEGSGPIGQHEIMIAQCVALIYRTAQDG